MKKLYYLLIFLLLSVFVLAQDLSNPESKLFAFAVIGDNGCGCEDQQRVAERMIEWHKEKPYSIVLMLGDNIYGKSLFERGGDRRLFYERFDRYYKPLIDQGVKFYAVLGNHDLETANGRDEIADQNRFHIMNAAGYYSFSPDIKVDEKPLITFYALNSTEIEDLGGVGLAQTKWLSQTLGKDQSLWKIAYAHHPIYTPKGTHSEAIKFRDVFEKILNAGGVRIFFSGHNHFYARMKVQNGLLPIVCGGGGRTLVTPKNSDLTAATYKGFSFVYAEVYRDNINFWAIPTSGQPFDQGVVARLP